jgi:hypothetical protein
LGSFRNFRSCILYIPFILSFPLFEMGSFRKIEDVCRGNHRLPRATCIKNARGDRLGSFGNFHLTADYADIADAGTLDLEPALQAHGYVSQKVGGTSYTSA